MPIESITLDHLLSRLPICEHKPSLIEDAVPDGVRYVAEGDEAFTAPTLAVDPEDLASAQVVVVSAPAAVGKSTLAEQIALRCGGVLWDLSKFRVGSNFAVGTLARSHGADELSATIRAVQNGKFLIVADGLDEARLRVNFDAFTAFLDDLAFQLLKAVPWGSPSVVVLARGETAEFTNTWLREEPALNVALAEIELFDDAQSLEFIDRQLASLGRDPNQPMLLVARDELLTRTKEILTREAADEDSVRRFLGYAPVLVATARYLASDANPRKIVERLLQETHAGPVWGFMRELIADLLRREQGKFLAGFRAAVSTKAELLGFDDWETLFGVGEQCRWLVGEALGVGPPAVVPAPADLDTEYRASVSDFLAQHPFAGASAREFASPVFEDYAYASVLTNSYENAGAAVRQRVASATYLPTEMLARFALAFAEGPILAENLPVIYESLISTGRRSWLSVIEHAENDGEMACLIYFGDESLRFDLLASGEPLQFISRLTRAGILSSTSDVYLGTGGRLFEIGPDVVIQAKNVVVAAESLFVDADPDDLVSVLVWAGSLTASDPALRFVHNGAKFMARTDATLRYPFADKAFPDVAWPAVMDESGRQAANAFFRLANYFKKDGYANALGSHADPIERLVARSAVTAAVMDVALEQTVIEREGAFFRFYPERLGLDYQAIRSHTVRPAALKFFVEAGKRLPT